MNSCVLGFNGERQDPISGITHSGNGYRAYNPALMCFHCPDNFSPFGVGGINPYAYCADDPVNRADPSGHFSPGQGIGMALGFVAGIALSIVTEGTAMPVALSLMAAVTGEAAMGAGTELVAEAADRQRVNWGLVGISAGLGAATALVGCCVGKAFGSINRRLGSWLQDRISFLGKIERGERRGFGIAMSGGREIATTEQTRQLSREERLAFIADPRNFIHTPNYQGVSTRIHSEPLNFPASHFINEYRADEWHMLENYRNPEIPVFTSDIIAYQYGMVARGNGFWGIMPDRITQMNVVNENTLQQTVGKTGETLKHTFLTKTVNGKSTSRVASEFGWMVTHVERESGLSTLVNFTVYLDNRL